MPLLRSGRFGGGSMMVWGRIAWNRLTALVEAVGNLNAQAYRDEILMPHVLPFIEATARMAFQQVNARPHVAHVNMAFSLNTTLMCCSGHPYRQISHQLTMCETNPVQVRRRCNPPQTSDLTHTLHEEWQTSLWHGTTVQLLQCVDAARLGSIPTVHSHDIEGVNLSFLC